MNSCPKKGKEENKMKLVDVPERHLPPDFADRGATHRDQSHADERHEGDKSADAFIPRKHAVRRIWS